MNLLLFEGAIYIRSLVFSDSSDPFVLSFAYE